MSDLQYKNFLPPYRSLVNPSLTYDYQTHRVIHLSPSDIKNIVARFQSNQMQKPKSAFQMKYRSLLSDVSLKASLLSRRVSSLKSASGAPSPPSPSARRCRTFRQLPVEIQITIFMYVDDHSSYRNCLYTCKHFYSLAKPLLLRAPSFSSTYRYSQFITYLRLNPAAGSYVLEVDLSGLRPGNFEAMLAHADRDYSNDESSQSDDVANYLSLILAGWRDWKFKNNLYAIHPAPLAHTKSSSSVPAVASHDSRRIKLSKYFKRRKSSTTVSSMRPSPQQHTPFIATSNNTGSSHPKSNKFLMSYASSKDIPIGYVLHLINLCPNLQSLNIANLTLSSDYEVKRSFRHKYLSYDLIHNYHKDMLRIVESIFPSSSAREQFVFNTTIKSSFAELASSASSVFSMSTFSKPIRKYNSLLPPLKLETGGSSYLKRGDDKLYLSDLNLKSINTAHLELVSQNEIFRCLERKMRVLQYLNMSSMIWINSRIVRDYLGTVLSAEISERMVDGDSVLYFRERMFTPGEPIIENSRSESSCNFVLDLRNSGMHKNLPWAQLIDTSTVKGEKLIYQILNDELVNETEELVIRERRRRGRVGENYFA